MPTQFFCTRYQEPLKPYRQYQGYQQFLTPDGKKHQCMKYNTRRPWRCNKLEVRGIP